MGLPRLLGFCAALLFASSVSAAVTIDLGPSDWRNLGSNGVHTPGGIGSSFGQTTRIPPTMTTLNVMRNPVVPYGSVGNALRTIGRATPQAVAASAGMAALFAAMDWVFDQGQWKKEDLMDENDPYGYYYAVPLSGGQTAPTGMQACQASTAYMLAGTTVTSISVNGSGHVFCNYQTPRGTDTLQAQRYGGPCSDGFQYVNQPPNVGCFKVGLVPLTDGDFSDLTAQLPALPAGDVAGAAGDAQRQLGNPLPGYTDTQISGPSSFSGPETTSTTVDPVTGDTTITTTSTTTNISYGDTTITTTSTTTTNTYQNGQQTSTTTTTETPGDLPVSGGGGGAGDWPGFCDWATVVCEWLLWTQEDPPPDQDLPAVIDEDFAQEKNISFGAKSCPPDYQISLEPFLASPVGVSFQPLCDFAGLIYYMVMAASYIIAAYISIGVARSA